MLRRWRVAKADTGVQRRRLALLGECAAQGLAGDRDHLDRRPGDDSDPRAETPLVRLRMQGGDSGAHLVVRGRAVGERPEPAQERKFLLAEAGNVDEALGSRQLREPT